MSRVLLLLALFVSPMALASEPPPPPGMSQGGGGGGGGGGDPEMDFMANFSEISQQLGLTDDQQSKIRDLFYSSQKQAIDLRAAEERTELDLRHAMSADTIDEKAVMKALDAHSELTPLGRILAQMPMEPILGKTIVMALSMG